MTLAGDPDLDRDPVEVRPLARDPVERLGQRRASSARGHRAPRTERRASVRLSRASSSAFARWRSPVGRAIGRLVGRLELGDDPGQALGDRVVDLAGHPLPLVEDARLAGLGEQLGVEAGVLLQRRLEPRERLRRSSLCSVDLLADAPRRR